MAALKTVVAAGLTVVASLIQTTKVSIDVKPGDNPTTIEVNRGGMIPVAILTTAQFYATTVDAGTVLVGPTGTEASPFKSMSDDVNGDGKADLMILIRLQEMRTKCGDTAIKVTGKTKSGVSIEGSEDVAIEGCPAVG